MAAEAPSFPDQGEAGQGVSGLPCLEESGERSQCIAASPEDIGHCLVPPIDLKATARAVKALQSPVFAQVLWAAVTLSAH